MTLTHITLFISQSGFIDIKVGSSALAVFYSWQGQEILRPILTKENVEVRMIVIEFAVSWFLREMP